MTYERLRRGAVAVGLVLLLSGCSEPSDPVISVAMDDPEMNAAIEKARGSLPHFWSVFAHPQRGERDFSLKVDITDEHGTEYFWIMEIARTDAAIQGTINNIPQTVKSVEFGERIDVAESDVIDWLYMRDGKMVGNETIKVLFKEMDPAERMRIKAMMADP